MKKIERNIFNSFNIYYRYYKKTGLYSFVISNLIKIFLVLVFVFILAFVINKFIIKLSELPEYLVDNFSTPIVLLSFFISESILGLIPPDFFILWVSEFDNFYLMVGVLGFVSYLGGLAAYGIGVSIRQIPSIKQRVLKFYSTHVDKIKKWGSLFIIIAALFPLPYAVACTVAGAMKFPLKNLVFIGVFRIIRFFIYAPIVIQIL